jgi:hypothetical protein
LDLDLGECGVGCFGFDFLMTKHSGEVEGETQVEEEE